MTSGDLRNERSLADMDRHGLVHPNTDLRAFAHGELGDPTIILGGKGIHIHDQQGRDYIDAFAGLWCVNVGYGRTEIADAIHRQAQQLAYYHAHWGFSNEPAIRLTERVLAMAPAGMSRIFWGLQGSDAHETQVKIAWYLNNVLGRPRKKKIISRERGYHGLTLMSASLTGIPALHAAFDLPHERVRHTVAPFFYRRADRQMSEQEFSQDCADRLDALIEAEGPDTVAAFIAEPVVGVGGIIPSPEGYWPAVTRVLRKHDVLLMADEIVCGFGRLGTAFGCDRYEIQPDMMSISKGLTSASFPLAGSVLGERVWNVLEEGSRKFGPFAHGFTYAAHPLGAAAAMANLDIIEREQLAANVRDVGPYLLARLRDTFADHQMVGDVRGEGLLACVEFVAERDPPRLFEPALQVGPRIAAACREQGLIVRALPDGDIVGFSPPLVITRAEVDEVVERFRRGVGSVVDEMLRAQEWRAS